MRERIAHIEKALEKRLLKKEKIFIHELVAYQINHTGDKPPLGEFSIAHVTSEKFNSDRAKIETSAEVMDRMMTYIQELSYFAAKVHRQKNSQKYHVTRLALNEFALYPTKSRGALSLTDFETLLTKIQAMAEKYPNNVHLLLATLPVIIPVTLAGKTVQDIKNIGIYVECGLEPKLHVFAKSIKANDDPLYPNSISQDHVNNPEENSPVTDQIAIKIGKRQIHLQHGGSFICQVNGQPLRVAVDICIEAKRTVAKRRVTLQIDSASRTGVATEPYFASYLLSSNVAYANPDAQVGSMITHIDPALSNKGALHAGGKIIKAIADYEIPNPSFGSRTLIDEYAAYPVEEHVSPLNTRINQINAFAVRLQAMHIYRDQHLTELDEISHEINQHIVKPVLDELIKKNLAPAIQKELLNLPTHRGEIVKILKRIHPTSDQIKKYIANAIHLLKIEDREKAIIKKQLKLAQSPKHCAAPATLPDNDVNLLQTSGATRSLPYIFSLPVEHALTQPAIAAPGLDSEHTTYHEPAMPLFRMENWVALQYLAHYSPFCFPWNKVIQLTTAELALLEKNVATLDALQKQGGMDSESELLLKNTRADIQQMLTRKTKTDASFKQLQNRMVRFEELLATSKPTLHIKL